MCHFFRLNIQYFWFCSIKNLSIIQNPNHESQLELSSELLFCSGPFSFLFTFVWSVTNVLEWDLFWHFWLEHIGSFNCLFCGVCAGQSFDLRLFDRSDSSIRLLPKKKSVATMLAVDHHSSRYHFVAWI